MMMMMKEEAKIQRKIMSSENCLSSSFCFVLILKIMWLVSSAASPMQKNESDRLALLSIKDQLISDPFHVVSSWNNSIHFCQWRGVTCSRRHARVTALNLEDFKLEGPLSPHLGNLSFLRVLSLEHNRLYGEIPPELGRLNRLQVLNLSSNFFSGEIPSNLSKCFHLKALSLSYNTLSGIVPSELSSLSRLEMLGLGGNHLTGIIPPTLGNLSFLSLLTLAQNSIGGAIPDDLGRLSRLQILDLGSNNISGTIPSSIYNVSNIVEIYIGGNKLIGSLAPHLGISCPHLEQLFVGRNYLTGRIPISLVNASHLSGVELAVNHFWGGIPGDLGRLENLTYINFGRNELGSGKDGELLFIDALSNSSLLGVLSVAYNNFGGSLPRSLGNLSSQFAELYFGNNKIYGPIPSEICNLIGLFKLGLDNILLSGGIPADIGKLKNLQGINLYKNFLSGEIPPSIGNLTRLVLFYAHENRLTGRIPSSIANCPSLEQLVLANNLFTGSLPESVFQLPSLNSLILEDNQFTGSLHRDVGNLINLNNLWLYDNNLSGTIPSTLGDCVTLVSVRMGQNRFVGSIPNTLSSLKGLEELDLSENNLSGQVPKYLATFVFLRALNLSFNQLEGAVPVDGIFSHPSNFSIAGNEKLCGGIRELHLPPCMVTTGARDHQPKRFSSIRLICILVPIGSSVLIVISCILVMYFRKRWIMNRTFMSESSDLTTTLQVSYAQIVKATENFASTNLVGSGSFGSVYKGYMDCFGRVVAIKVLNLECRRAFKSFAAECEALRNIRHRNLVKLLTSCSSIDNQGMDFKALIYDFMPNGDLEMRLHSQEPTNSGTLPCLSFAQRLDVALDVAFALDYLHNQCDTAVVHCDLKPSNVLLDEGMVARLSDFGMAKVISNAPNSDSSSQQSTLILKGTIGYISPEYGTGGEVTRMGDVYGYGVLLLEMFTGKRPTHGMFTADLNLPTYARMAFPEKVIDILDPQMISYCTDDDQDNWSRVQKASVSVIQIGIECTASSPKDRINMDEVCRKLVVIKRLLLGFGAQMEPHDWRQIIEEGPSYLSYL